MTTMPRNTQDTQQQFKDVMQECRDLFGKKLIDYGASWRIMRTSSLTDQLFIKAKRIRSLEVKGEAWVDEGIRPEFIAIINYGIVHPGPKHHAMSPEHGMSPIWGIRQFQAENRWQT